MFDWLRRARKPAANPREWRVQREGSQVVVTLPDGERRVDFAAARTVRLVPVGVGPGHGMPRGGAGWQVAVARADGDALVGPPTSDWQGAWEFAGRLCEASGLPMDELSQRMFSQLVPPKAEEDADA